jgi:hypothetical protein
MSLPLLSFLRRSYYPARLNREQVARLLGFREVDLRARLVRLDQLPLPPRLAPRDAFVQLRVTRDPRLAGVARRPGPLPVRRAYHRKVLAR